MAQTLTGALGLIRVNGEIIGGLYEVNITENHTRTRVNAGIGSIKAKEYAMTQYEGSLNANQAFIDLQSSVGSRALKKNAQTSEQWETSNILDSSVGIQVDIFKDVEDAIDTNTGLAISSRKPIAVISDLMVDSFGWNVSDGNFSTSNFSGNFITEIKFPQDAG